MIFKIFKEMVAAVKEGVAEAKAELAEENAVKQVLETQQLDALRNQPQAESFAVALGAPHRWIFIGETAYDLCSTEIAAAKKDEIAKLLIRDFGADSDLAVTGAVLTLESVHYATAMLNVLVARLDGAQTEADSLAILADVERIRTLLATAVAVGEAHRFDSAMIPQLLTNRNILYSEYRSLLKDNLADETKAGLAAIAARASYLTFAGAGIGLLPKEDALALMAPLASAAEAHFSSWADYAEHHEQGEKLDKTNNAIGRKLLRDACRRLQTEPASPWVLFGFSR
ncbi:DUF1266 domain-containing protein [Sphingorhabdus sp.]|uniref:DUF1266 domain-containing protein n=1 Tax=Sphingorhabdus sp. TaxID=1902408 RepID=UPI0032B7A3B1